MKKIDPFIHFLSSCCVPACAADSGDGCSYGHSDADGYPNPDTHPNRDDFAASYRPSRRNQGIYTSRNRGFFRKLSKL